MKLERVCEVSEDQKHKEDIESLVLMGNRVFSGADDGIIKIWSSEDLKLLHEFQAHEYAVNHLLLLGDRLYSASMDQTVKSWQLDTWKLVATFVGHEDTPRKLATDGEFIFCGDDIGEVRKWTKDGRCVAKYEMVEEVWDLHIKLPHIYTVRDRGLTITEIKDNRSSYAVVRTIEGRAPFYICGDDLVMLNRNGIVIDHYLNKPPSYDFTEELKGHEKIVTAMTGWGEFLLTSGYDEKLFLWSLKNGELLGSSPLKGCPNAMCSSHEGEVFVGGPSGYLVKIKILP